MERIFWWVLTTRQNHSSRRMGNQVDGIWLIHCFGHCSCYCFASFVFPSFLSFQFFALKQKEIEREQFTWIFIDARWSTFESLNEGKNSLKMRNIIIEGPSDEEGMRTIVWGNPQPIQAYLLFQLVRICTSAKKLSLKWFVNKWYWVKCGCRCNNMSN